MPTTRGLELLETLDVHGPLTVTEIARLTGHDKSWVSRIVTACESDGWIVREQGRVALGPRAALLAHGSAAGELIRRAQPLVEAIAGVTGLTAQAYGLAGRYAIVLAAAGQVIAAQLDPETLERLLPRDPFPDPLAELLADPGYQAFAAGRFAPLREVPSALPAREVTSTAPAVPRDRGELQTVLAAVSEHGAAIDNGDLHPQIGCVAVPWLGSGDVAALACMGSPAEIAAAAGLARTVLDAAAAPAATREDVVQAAARARHYSVAP